jgi:DNA-binding LytR/AlgR family response regulator
MHCLVVDDQPVRRDRLVRLLMARGCVGRVTPVRDTVEMLRVIGRTEVDVAFLEARAAGPTGPDPVWPLRRLRAAPAVVLVTDRPAPPPGTVADGIGFLPGSARPDELTDVLRWAGDYRQRGGRPCGAPVDRSPADPDGSLIAVAVGRNVKLVPRSSVRWAEARRDYVRLHTADGSYLIRARLGALADSWRQCGLLRIHRSYLVRTCLVTGLSAVQPGRFVVVIDGRRLPVSRGYLSRVRDRLGGSG